MQSNRADLKSKSHGSHIGTEKEPKQIEHTTISPKPLLESGKGCSWILNREVANNPVAWQLLHGLLTYMESAQFNPKTDLAHKQVRGLTKLLDDPE